MSEMAEMVALGKQLRKHENLMTKIKKTKVDGEPQCQLYVRKYRNHPWEKYTGSVGGESWTLGEHVDVPETWSCKLCSVLNSKTRTQCLICRSNKPENKRLHAIGDWYCCLDSCLALNVATQKYCKLCGTSRHAGKGELVTQSDIKCRVIVNNVSAKTTTDDVQKFFSPLTVCDVVMETDLNGLFNKQLSAYFTSAEDAKEALKKGGDTLRGRKVFFVVPLSKAEKKAQRKKAASDKLTAESDNKAKLSESLEEDVSRKRKRGVPDVSEKTKSKYVKKESKWKTKIKPYIV